MHIGNYSLSKKQMQLLGRDRETGAYVTSHVPPSSFFCETGSLGLLRIGASILCLYLIATKYCIHVRSCGHCSFKILLSFVHLQPAQFNISHLTKRPSNKVYRFMMCDLSLGFLSYLFRNNLVGLKIVAK